MIPKIKKILYATDLSKNSAYAFFYAVDMAKNNGAEIVILHSIEPPRHITYVGVELEDMIKEAEKQKREAEFNEIKKRVEEFCKKMDAHASFSCLALVSKTLVPVGNPVEEILEAANEENCDVIVLGTHGKGFLKQTFIGSVAIKVLERARKPVFVIPLPSEKTSIDWDSL